VTHTLSHLSSDLALGEGVDITVSVCVHSDVHALECLLPEGLDPTLREGCTHWFHNLLPEGLQRDIFSGDEDELALTLLVIVELLQYPLSVLQKARRHALASPSLVASEEMPPFESANRHTATSQKLPTSKQPTPPAAPTSAPPLRHPLFRLLRLLPALYL